MPEEINRVLTDALADYLFVTEEDAVDNFVREGRSLDCIYLVGNVMIDALRYFIPLAQKSRMGEELGWMFTAPCTSRMCLFYLVSQRGCRMH